MICLQWFIVTQMAFLMSASAIMEALTASKDGPTAASCLKLADTTLTRYRKAAAAFKDRQDSSSEAAHSDQEKWHIYYLMLVRPSSCANLTGIVFTIVML